MAVKMPAAKPKASKPKKAASDKKATGQHPGSILGILSAKTTFACVSASLAKPRLLQRTSYCPLHALQRCSLLSLLALADI